MMYKMIGERSSDMNSFKITVEHIFTSTFDHHQTRHWILKQISTFQKRSGGPKINKNCCNKFPNKQNPKNSRTHGRHSVSKWLSCYSASEQRLKFGLSEVPPGACPLKSGLWRSGKIGGEVASIGDVWETGKIRIAVRNKFMFCIACMCNLYHEIMIWWYGWITLNHMQELHVTFQFNTSINYIITMFFSHPECTNF